jgi:hypothetical protein
MWLGRIEIYLTSPQGTTVNVSEEDIRRQAVDALLISELFDMADAEELYADINRVLEFFLGEQDNVTLPNLNGLKDKLQIESAAELLDSNKFKTFRDSLKAQPYAMQRILSQVLYNDPMKPGDIQPASAFMLFGQRFIVDSYITDNVVYDKINYNGSKIKRMLPSSLDVLYALGNDASAQLLEPELEEYHYSSNLAALRYLVDSYGKDFWYGNIYNLWLNSIRTLNPPRNRSELPPFMQTGVWWQQKMNTQLAGWTQLRHANILYAKQSYSGGTICSYPYSYVEPIPEFFKEMKNTASRCKDFFSTINFSSTTSRNWVLDHFDHFENTMDTLLSVAEKELSGEVLTDSEKEFLESAVYDNNHCGWSYDGWYVNLFFDVKKFLTKDYLVADYHTAPTDKAGNMVGWVKHAGTGPIDLAFLSAELPSGEEVAFVGPVMSFHEYTSTNFLRLNDKEWRETYLEQSNRPDWVNVYLANENGESRGEGAELITDIQNERGNTEEVPESHIIVQNYPNPFNSTTVIKFSVPQKLSNQNTKLNIYNINGELINQLVNKKLPAGNYMTRWNGTNSNGTGVASGIYLYEVVIGTKRAGGKMSLLK